MKCDLIDAMLEEVNRPSGTAPGPMHRAYERAVVGIGHLVLGAAVGGMLWPVTGWPEAIGRLTFGAAYWGIKEAGDLRRGGTVRDGIEDAALVTAGLFYAGQWWAPGAAILIGAYLMARGARQ
jgi:hypothetical protein